MLRRLYANPAAVIFLMAFVILAGIIRFFGLPIALYPQTSRPTWVVQLTLSTVEPEDFKDQYGETVDAKLRAIVDVKEVKATYEHGSVNWQVTFDWDSDIDKGLGDIRAALAGVEAQFPKDWDKFQTYLDQGSAASIYLSLYSPEISPSDLASLMNDRIKGRLDQIEGLEYAFISKPFEQEVNIRLKPDLLAFYGILPETVRTALRTREYNHNLGKLKVKNGMNHQITVPLRDESVEEIAATVVGQSGERIIRLHDIADVAFMSVPPRYLIKGNGQRGLIVGGKVKSSGNIAAVCDEFEAIVRSGAASVDAKISVDVLVNPSQFIQESIVNIGESVISGILIATLIIFLFLGSFRLTLVIALAIPLSLIGGFIVMSLTDIELNLISLGAMALSSGMVVDGSTVVLENIIRHFEERPPQSMRERLDTTIAAVAEVRTAVLASTITSIIVFAPLAYTAPLANAILGDLAKVMVCVMLISLGVTLVVVPPLLLVLQPRSQGRVRGIYRSAVAFQAFINWTEAVYLGLLRYLFSSKLSRLALLGALTVCFFASLYLLEAHVKREILAEPDTDKVQLYVGFEDRRYEIDEADRRIQAIEATMTKEFAADLTHYYTSVMEHGAFFLCNLRDKRQVKEFKARLEKRFTNSPALHFYVSAWVPSSLEIPHPPLLRIRYLGGDSEEKREAMQLVSELASDDEAIGRITSLPSLQRTSQYMVQFREELLHLMNSQKGEATVSSDQLESLIAYALREMPVKNITRLNELIPVKMGLATHQIESPDDLGNLLVNVAGRMIPLRHFFSMSQQSDWQEFYVEDGREQFKTEIYIKDSYADTKTAVAKRLKDKILSEPGISAAKIAFDDTDKEINDNIVSLGYALALALALIWLTIILQFGRVKQAAIVMSAIPLGFIGVAIALAGFSSTLSVNSMLGIILLCGTAVNNSIVFVDFYNQLSKRDWKLSSTERLLLTARLRYRPILITVATTILGMFPIALGFGSGGEILQPLGIAVCGGLGISTCLTLVVVPLLMLERTPRGTPRAQGALGVATATWLAVLGASLGQAERSEAAEALAASERAGKRLSLREVEVATMAQDPELASFASAAGIAEVNERQLLASLLPRVSVELSLSRPTSYTESGRETRLSISEEIPNPLSWQSERAASKLGTELVDLRREFRRQELLLNAREQYFKLAYCLVEQTIAEQSLQLFAEFKGLSEKRYSNGYIAYSDSLRTGIQHEEQSSRLAEVTATCQLEKERLAALMGQAPTSQLPSLSTRAQIPLKHPSLTPAKLTELAGTQARVALKPEAKDVQVAGASVHKAYHDTWVPSLSLGASVPIGSPSPAPTSYTATLSWNLFAGGRDYYNYRTRVYEESAKQYELQKSKQSYEEGTRSLIAQLGHLQALWQNQDKIARSWQEVAGQTRQRYAGGLVSSKDVSDDLTSLLQQRQKQMEIEHDIVKTLTRLSFTMKKPELLEAALN